MSRWLWLALLLCALVPWRNAAAHEFRPAVLTVRAQPTGEFAYRFEPPLDDQRRPIHAVRPVFAEHCEVTPRAVDCHGRGLGSIEIEGLPRYPVDTVVRIVWLDGSEHHVVLHGDSNRAELPDRHVGASGLAVASVYIGLGVEHILVGADHVLFVLGLTALVGLRRRLLWTITGFTAAHSITLALSALGGVSLPSRPVEVGIALSIALLAVEIVDDRPTLTRRAPGAIAFAFGLLHGMGFAGALAEIGIPADRSTLALLGFNAGVELGQLAIVAAAAAASWACLRLGLPARRATVLCAYVGGSLAVAWALQRWLPAGV